MSLSFDDRILGEKVDYYCSSSESDGYESCDEFEDCKEERNTQVTTKDALNNDGAPNTGPKGVVEDWRRYKKLENEKREEANQERLLLAKKLAITCRTNAKDEEEKKKDEKFVEEMEENLEDFDEEFIKLYRMKRIEALRSKMDTLPKFGKVIELNKISFVDAIDKENPQTTIVIHIYRQGIKACNQMAKCFGVLSTNLPIVKFCSLEASQVQLSIQFSISGVPAILVYKGGELLGNFVKLKDEFGDEFTASDVESFLVEHGLLPDDSSQFMGSTIKSGFSYKKNTTDSSDDD